MPDSSWRSTAIQALVLCLVLALAWLKAVSSETTAGALGMIVMAIFMGQQNKHSLQAVQNATNAGASTPRFPAVGANERVTVAETREGPPLRGRVAPQPTPGELRVPRPGRHSGGEGSGGYGGGEERRVALVDGLLARGDTYAFLLIAFFVTTCVLLWYGKLAVAALLVR